MSAVSYESGLPDYVRDHFEYLVRSSAASRLVQAVFFISGLIFPVMLMLAIPDLEGNKVINSYVPLIVTAAVFTASMIGYVAWVEIRLLRFRRERPESYQRWFGWRNRRLGSRDVMGQLELIRMQMRYVFLGKEPSDGETLELTMRMVRRAA
jgi:nitric oxide reductase large subunit